MVLDQKQTPITHVEKRQIIDGQRTLQRSRSSSPGFVISAGLRVAKTLPRSATVYD
jgi:hypothetical protein